MNPMPDLDTIIAAWLDDGPTDLPNTTRRAIAAALPTTSQRRRSMWAPWRFSPMPVFARAAIAVLVAAVVIGGGIYLLGPRVIGPGGPTVPSPSPADGTTKRANVFAHPFEYVATAKGDPIEASRDLFIYGAPGFDAAAVVWVVREYLDDPCHYESSGRQPLEQGVEALLAQLRATSFIELVEQPSITVDGRTARVFTVTARTDERACDAPHSESSDAVRLWPDSTNPSPESQHMTLAAGGSARLIMFELEGDTIVLETWGDGSWLPEADRFIRSLRFGPAAS